MLTDGSRIYFEEVSTDPTWPLLQVSAEGGEAIPLAVPLKGFDLEAISPNGLDLLVIANDYIAGGSELWWLPMPGMQPRQIGNSIHGARWATLSPDGKALYYSAQWNIFAADENGDHPRWLLTRGHPSGSERHPTGNFFVSPFMSRRMETNRCGSREATGPASGKCFRIFRIQTMYAAETGHRMASTSSSSRIAEMPQRSGQCEKGLISGIK
jgi:hypothetical protein